MVNLRVFFLKILKRWDALVCHSRSDISLAELTLMGRNKTYEYYHSYFYYRLPKELREHRRFFSENKRGFGEDAFHAMWYVLFSEYKPRKVLEIGVYRGQTVTLWGLIAKLLNYEISVHGISPFSSEGDQVSKYSESLDYYSDTCENNRHFQLNELSLLKAYSNDINALEYIENQNWDLIYIDGNHDYEVALSDYMACKKSLRVGGVLVIDDSSLHTEYVPARYSFKGHPGPSDVVERYAMKELEYLGAVGHNNIFIRV